MEQAEKASHVLARSAFGFALLALIPTLIAWIWLILAPASPSASYQQIQLVIKLGFGVVVLALCGLTIYTFRAPIETLNALAEKLSQWLDGLALLLVLILIEANVLALLALTNIAPSITNPLKFLLICWSLLLIGMIGIVKRESLKNWFKKTGRIWQSIGLVVSTSLVLGLVILLNSVLLQVTGFNDRLRGGLDYRELTFFDDGQPMPSTQDFWREQAQLRVRWSPYTYWVVDEVQGQYINVSADGLRYTPDTGATETSPSVYVFGGSTVWGEGARDTYMIPAHIGRLLANEGQAVRVVNYGQTGYVSSQDMLFFQLQLLSGNAPDIAIFYQGFNDTLSAWSNDYVGLSLQENMRLNDAEAGRLLRAGQPVLRLPNYSLDEFDFSQAGVSEASPQAVVDRWLANVQMIETLATAYDVQVLFVWQPAIIHKTPLTDFEQAVYARYEQERVGLFEFYAEVDKLVQAQVQQEHILLLGDLFANDERSIFYDLVHITEVGNATVAEALLPSLKILLERSN